jgi:hypothetical protein
VSPNRTNIEPDGIAPMAAEFRVALHRLIDAIPGQWPRPTALARSININRVILSRLLNAMKSEQPLEMLQKLPGPESLRAIIDGIASQYDVPQRTIHNALHHVDRFDALIRQFGTRSALDAAISHTSHSFMARYEESARYGIYNGMRHIMGIEGDTWLMAMIFSPSEHPESISVTTVHGAIAMRLLRPDVPVRFTFGPPYKGHGIGEDPVEGDLNLEQFYANTPASLETERCGGQVVHRLVNAGLGKDNVVDMLAMAHNPRGAARYASNERRMGGAAVFCDIPVRTLHCDLFVHRDIFPDSAPELRIYHNGARGLVNPNDTSRELDRVTTAEAPQRLPAGLDWLDLPSMPRYPAMMAHVFERSGLDFDAYRVHRLRIAYPILGFQHVLAFAVPSPPAQPAGQLSGADARAKASS